MPSYHGDQVPEPLVGELMSNHQCHPLPGGRAGVLWVDEQCRFPGKEQKSEVKAKTGDRRRSTRRLKTSGFLSIKHSESTSAAGLFIKKTACRWLRMVDGRSLLLYAIHMPTGYLTGGSASK